VKKIKYERIIDPDSKIICRTCLKTLPRTNEFFAKNNKSRYGLLTTCKKCDNFRRTTKQKQRAYHNIKKHCKTCGAFFYASLAHINLSKKRNFKNTGKYCSKECSPIPKGMTGKSWNGARRGENNPYAILSDKIVRTIKLCIKSGMKNKDIASVCGIEPERISAIKTNRAWSHIKI
jgi:hypothetical protein